MSTKSIFSLMASSFLMVAALLCSARSSRSQTQTQSQSRPQPQLPDGNGKEIVQRACTACHALNQVTNSGHSADEWKIVMAMMVNVGAPITKAEAATVTDYLTQNFPEKPKPAAVVVAGNANVSIEEWEVPTPGSRPHDPLWTPDGNMWYSGHMANVLGRFDPRTQKFTEFHPKVPGSGPHGLVADKDGNIWFTANFKGYIGKLDPKTGDVTEYDLPDPNARDPHTPLFAPNGMLFFTVQSANMVGRLNPKTGEIKMVTSPTPKSNPYGMVMSSKGVPIFCEFGSNKIASIDPETLAIHEWVLPHEDSHPRRIAITADDAVWYSDYARGYLGRLDTKTGKVTNEWPSPSEPKCQPYAITAIASPGSAAIGLVLSAAAHAYGWPVPKGGSQMIASALLRYFESLGGEIITEFKVEKWGELPASRVVLFDTAPRTMARISADHLPQSYVRALERYPYGPGIFKLDWALNAPIPWKARECLTSATVHVGGTLEEIAESERAPWNNKCAENPFVLVTQPSLFDSTRAPEQKHTAWGYCHVPKGCDVDMTQRIEDQIARFAPGFRDVILCRAARSPAVLESENANLVGGDVGGGSNELVNLFFRPTWRMYSTPAPDVYLCSASTPPGGGVHGMCGVEFAEFVWIKNGLAQILK